MAIEFSAVTTTRPAQAALLPALVDTPAQLTAANVVSGWVESVSLLTGPALASVMLAISGPGGALAVFAVLVGGSAVLVLPLPARGADAGEADGEPPPASLIPALRAAPGAIPALCMLGAEYAAIGALDVLEVVLAAGCSGSGRTVPGVLARRSERVASPALASPSPSSAGIGWRGRC